MAVFADSHCSSLAELIIKHVSQLECSTDGKKKIGDYLQHLKCNKHILAKCLTQLLNSVDDMYYNDGTSPWSDCQYDCFIECLKIQNLDVAVVDKSKVGAVVSATAVKLPHFMASMNKYKTIGEIKSWCRKFRGPYTVTAKLDGVSAMYYHGKLYTRGNGICGRDISYLIPFLKQKMDVLGKDYEFGLRGELIIRKTIFDEKYSTTFANSRNLVCGLLNRVYSKENEEFYCNIDFVVYDVYHRNPLRFSNKIKIIENSGCRMVQYNDNIGSDKMNNLDLLDTILKKWKTQYHYEIDGIIVTSDKHCIHSKCSNPDFAFAYKNNVIGVEMNEATVDKVLWNVSKDNYLKPKIKLTEKVLCNGSQIEYVTGFNAKYILQNNIKNGTIVKIGLSGNVIPHIFEIVGGGELVPSIWEDLTDPITQKLLENIESGTYSWNKTKVDLINTNNDNHASIIKKNMVFFHSFEIKCGLQETTLSNLYKSLGVYKLADVLSLNVQQWEQVQKVGTKKGENIVRSLKSGIDSDVIEQCPKVSEEYFMKWLLGLQCFPRGFGKKKLESHIKYVKHVCHFCSQVEFYKLYDLNYFKSLEKVFVGKIEEFKTPQVTNDSIELFCRGFSEFIEKYDAVKIAVTNIQLPSLKSLLKHITENDKSCDGGGDTEVGKKGNVVFSGVRDKGKESYYLSQGYEISDSVNSNTKLLIVKDNHTKSTKIKKALELGIQIISLYQL
jgi:NAD-dependent DNA ligase